MSRWESKSNGPTQREVQSRLLVSQRSSWIDVQALMGRSPGCDHSDHADERDDDREYQRIARAYLE